MRRRETRIGMLLGREVVDINGERMGRVHSVRLCRDGPILPNFGPALRIDALFVGKRSIASRLGLDRPNVRGPWPLAAWGERAARTKCRVPVDVVEDLDAGVIKCLRARRELIGTDDT